MIVFWLVLAFLAGMAFWHWCGGWLFRKFGLKESVRANMIRSLSTEALVLLRREASEELARRQRVIEEGQ